MSKNFFPLVDSYIDLGQVSDLVYSGQPVAITASAQKKINDCRAYLDRKTDNGHELYYGVNTGFGYLQNVKIDKGQLQELQVNLLKSHACGLGEEVPGPIVKLAGALEQTLALRIPVHRVEPGSLPRFELKAKRWHVSK